MRKKILTLLVMIGIFATLFVVGSSFLIQKSKQLPREEEISLAEVERLLSAVQRETAHAFLKECETVTEEKGYLPKEETLQRMIAFVGETEPDLEFGYRTLLLVSVSGETLLAMKQDKGELFTYQMQGSYNIHSFDSVFRAAAQWLRRSAGNGRPPVPGGI